MVACRPPIACRSAAGSAAKRLAPSRSTRLTWTCMPFAACSANGLAMKVACRPSARAAALIARLSRKAWSAARSGSATWPRLISSWPGAYSETALLAGQVLARAVVLQPREKTVLGIERLEPVDSAGLHARHEGPGCAAGRRDRPGHRAGRTRARARRPGSGRAARSGPRPWPARARGSAKNGRPSGSPSPASTCAPPGRQGTGASVVRSIRQGRSASPSSQTRPDASTLAPVASRP